MKLVLIVFCALYALVTDFVPIDAQTMSEPVSARKDESGVQRPCPVGENCSHMLLLSCPAKARAHTTTCRFATFFSMAPGSSNQVQAEAADYTVKTFGNCKAGSVQSSGLRGSFDLTGRAGRCTVTLVRVGDEYAAHSSASAVVQFT